jgi:hypothetical protein
MKLTVQRQLRLASAGFWSFCYAKQKNLPADKQEQFGYGDDST